MAGLKALSTQKSIGGLALATFRTIADRLAKLSPSIVLDEHVAHRQTPKGVFSTLDARDSTLDGINFVATDAGLLAEEFETANGSSGRRALISMKEDPDHWALKASFGKTVGTGWREVWRPEPFKPKMTLPEDSAPGNSLFRMRFGNAGTPIRFTALHCAVDKISGKCNVHIDESGFVLETSYGVALTPDLYDHFVNELLLKTEFRDWLAGDHGKISNEAMREAVNWVLQRTNLHYPNASNGYAGLSSRAGSMRVPQSPLEGLKMLGRIAMPVGLSFDIYNSKELKAQVTGSLEGGQKTITLSLGGEW